MNDFKEFKALREETEKLRDDLKAKALKIKQTKLEIRRLENDLKQKSKDISELEVKYKESVNYKGSSRVLSKSELEHFHSVFFSMVSINIFDSFTSLNTKKATKNVIPVDVYFEGVSISFYINKDDTFETLRKHAASYWALPEDEIFFSDCSSDGGVQPVFLLNDNVLDELYIWKSIKLKHHNFLLYLVLRNYSSLKDKMQEVFPRDESDKSDQDVTLVDINLMEAFKKKKIIRNVLIDKTKELNKRKFWHRVQYASQWIMYLVLFLLWNFTLGQDIQSDKAVWVNRRISQVLLWNFQYNDFETTSMYGPTDNQFLSVTSIESLWVYIESIQKKFSNGYETGILSNHIYGLEYIELRQVRTEVKNCDFKGIFNYSCTDNYLISKGLTDDFGTESFQKYVKRRGTVFVYGESALYPDDGFLNHVDLQDEVDWYRNISTLRASGWIDAGTRAVFITINVYNPVSDIFSLIMPYFEISSSGFFIQNFKFYSFKGHIFSGTRLTAHVFIFLLIFALVSFEIRQNIRHPEEVLAFIYEKSKMDQDKLYDVLEQNHKVNICKRLKRPSFEQAFGLFSLVLTFILEVISVSMYLGKFKKVSQVNVGYNNLFSTLQGVSMLNDAKIIVTLFLAMNLIRYVIIWLSQVNRLFQAVVSILSNVGYYFILTLIPILIFSTFFYYFLGPNDSAFNSSEKSFISVIQIFCGKWPSNKNFQHFIGSEYLVLAFFVFFTWRMFIMSTQAILFSFELSKSKTL